MLIYYSIFILLLSLSLQSNDFCNSYLTCFSCNWQFNCEWSSNSCRSLNESKRESSWLSSVNSCSNKSNDENIIPYAIPFTINYTFPSSNANITESHTILQKWTINEIDPKRTLKLTLSNNINKHSTDITILITLTDGTVLFYRIASYDTFHIICQDVSSVDLLLLYEDSLYTNNSNANILSHRYNQSLTFEGKYTAMSSKKIFCVIFFISISVLSLTSLILFIYVKIIRKKKQMYVSTDRSECVILANKKILERILSKRIYEEEKEEKCTICCEIIKKGNCVTLLNCNHIFHYQCIYHWAFETINHPTCPNCKKSLLNPTEEKNPKIITVNVTSHETVQSQ